MITVQDIVTLLEGLAPPALAESWDNVGLLCGDRAREVTNVLCSLDITEQVVAEATERGAQMIELVCPDDAHHMHFYGGFGMAEATNLKLMKKRL